MDLASCPVQVEAPFKEFYKMSKGFILSELILIENRS
jgi:hypothetical protein